LEIGEDDMAKRPSARSKATDPGAPAPPKPKRARTRAPVEQEPVGPPADPASAPAEAIADAPAEPTADDIRRRAYQRYQQRGGNHGQHFDDWLEAERELRIKK
jgi:hypothetical protein